LGVDEMGKFFVITLEELEQFLALGQKSEGPELQG
jgi:hypothetical protein